MTEPTPATGDQFQGPVWPDRPADANHVRLIEALRQINEVLLSPAASPELLASLASEAERLLATLRAAAGPQKRGQSQTFPIGHRDDSPVSGWINAVAPPVRFWETGNEVHGTATFSAAYQGPPGCLHGGVIAAVFDDILGAAQHLGGTSGMTGTLTVRYRRPTPLFREIHFRARHERTQGRKIFVAATLHVDGLLCADAEAVFIRVDFEALRRRGAQAEV